MGFNYSRRSRERLEGVHPDLRRVFLEVIKHADCTIVEGVRTLKRQNDLLADGKSKTLKSKHLVQADGFGHAVDAIAYPINWDDRLRNTLFAGFVKGVAASLGVKLRIGADWDGDFYTKDQRFHDLVHFELKGDSVEV